MDATAQAGPGVRTDDGTKRVNLRAVLSPARVVTSLILRITFVAYKTIVESPFESHH